MFSRTFDDLIRESWQVGKTWIAMVSVRATPGNPSTYALTERVWTWTLLGLFE